MRPDYLQEPERGGSDPVVYPLSGGKCKILLPKKKAVMVHLVGVHHPRDLHRAAIKRLIGGRRLEGAILPGETYQLRNFRTRFTNGYKQKLSSIRTKTTRNGKKFYMSTFRGFSRRIFESARAYFTRPLPGNRYPTDRGKGL